MVETGCKTGLAAEEEAGAKAESELYGALGGGMPGMGRVQAHFGNRACRPFN